MSELRCTDVHSAIADLPSGTADQRARAFSEGGPSASLAHVLGVPFKMLSGAVTWASVPVTAKLLRDALTEALGVSALLTHMNPRNRTLHDLGAMCADKRHVWAYRWLTVGMLLRGYDLNVELAFARDARLHLSWPDVDAHVEPRSFIATGTLKDWLSFTAHASDGGFDVESRLAMRDCAAQLALIVPGACSVA